MVKSEFSVLISHRNTDFNYHPQIRIPLWEPVNPAEIPVFAGAKVNQSINKSKKRFIKEGEKTVSLYPSPGGTGYC